ncbi:hypothetical protein [Streptomyces sp. Sge12]|uniref:hypothetical protein n=1 Tax=Streptomyces sp. Sge12 TaxID=1972846 RepID=UPI0013317362|nr:hypothetical protein [Streptomyces sp. Sge12]
MEGVRTGLAAWLVREAPARLRACGAPAELRDAVRLLGLAHADRWDGPAGTAPPLRLTRPPRPTPPPTAHGPRPLLRQR